MKLNHPGNLGTTSRQWNRSYARRTSRGQVSLYVGAVGAILALAFYIVPKALARSRPESPARAIATTPKPAQSPAARPGLPLRLKIPKINLDAAVEQVGMTVTGALETPASPTSAAWYQPGPRPGEPGSAVIDGHLDWANGAPAVFGSLRKLQPGDRLYIEDDKGSTITFVVRALQVYGKNDNDTPVFISNDTKAHLNLITCQGDWNKSARSYSDRLVVFAVKD